MNAKRAKYLTELANMDATQAKELTEADSQFQSILKEIERTALKGEFMVNVYLHGNVIRALLEQEGYKLQDIIDLDSEWPKAIYRGTWINWLVPNACVSD
jgi:cupin superfamily acireductone dioxygenase involved in methionine salvage